MPARPSIGGSSRCSRRCTMPSSEALAMSSAIAGTLAHQIALRIRRAPRRPGGLRIDDPLSGSCRSGSTSSTRSSIRSPRTTTSSSRCWKRRCPRPESSSSRSFSLERGLFAAPALLERLGEPRNAGRSRQVSAARRPQRRALGAHHAAAARPNILPSRKRSWSVRTPISGLQAALAGHGVLRVTASYTREPSRRGCCGACCRTMSASRSTCMRCCPARQFVPAKVRCFLEALEAQAHGQQARRRPHPLPG